MRIAIDSSPLTSGDSVRGVGVYTRELIHALGKRVEAINFKTSNLTKYDIIHYPYFSPFRKNLPILKPTKTVVTIHDLIPLIYPKYYPPGIRGSINFFLQKLALNNVNAIITDTETSKKDIIRFLNIDPKKIFVIYLAPQSHSGTKQSETIESKLPNNFVLYIGDVNYNKNLLNLAKACKLANLKLVIVGKQSVLEDVDNNIENRPWKAFLRAYKNDTDIIRLGYVANLDEVFKKAKIYCQPSLYEGFGIPVLEAFQRNVPVAAARTQALVEVGDNACIYFNPYDPKDIAEKLSAIVKDKKLANDLVRNGKDRLKNFSWEKCADETLEVYKHVYDKS